MRILIAGTYYRPYTSGVTLYIERLANGLTQLGHTVTILTSHYDPSLPLREVVNGVRIVRAPVVARVSKGVIMPTIGWLATALSLQNDAMIINLPQFDAPGLALRGRLLGQPVVLLYHCDLQLPPGLFNRVANSVVNLCNNVAGTLATAIVAYTQDYADNTPFLTHYSEKVRVIPPPVEMPLVSQEEAQAFARRWNIQGPVIGMAARLAAEKGVEVLLNALPRVLKSYPDARVMFAGTYQNVLGEEAYAQRLAPIFERYSDHWTFLGNLGQRELAAFFANCETLVVPSLNSTESFGLVQIESMLCGTPSIASALPGVRQPVLQTGMGEVVPIGDSDVLAEAITRVIRNRQQYLRPRAEIAARFSVERTARGFVELLEELRSTEKH